MNGVVLEKLNFKIDDQELRESTHDLCLAVRDAGGEALIVGGSVRDAALGLPAIDIDIEVRGLEPADLLRLLKKRFRVNLVGQSFGVLKISGLPIDVAIPRRESKRGLGHRGFEVHSDPSLSVREAASRRDFTINAIAYNPLTEEVVDPFNGMADLQARVLRHTTDKFSEDPLRVLRGMQFAARFELAVAPETVELCHDIEPEGLAAERIFDEWSKLMTYGRRPSLGLRFLRDCGWIRYFPELDALIGCEQDPQWHPEGDVWEHTLHAMDAFAELRIHDDWEDLVVGFAVLCHDFGKPLTSRVDDGRIRSKGHDTAGAGPARVFLERMTTHRELVDSVIALVTTHMQPMNLFKSQAGDAAIRRLSRHVGRIDRLVRVDRADSMGCGPGTNTSEAADWLLSRAEELAVADAAPRPLVLGRHLIEMGLQPGPEFGQLLEKCYEDQLEGEFSTVEEGVARMRKLLAKSEED